MGRTFLRRAAQSLVERSLTPNTGHACYGVVLVTLLRSVAGGHLEHSLPGLSVLSSWCLPVMALEMALGSKDAFRMCTSISGLSQDSVGDSGDSGLAYPSLVSAERSKGLHAVTQLCEVSTLSLPTVLHISRKGKRMLGRRRGLPTGSLWDQDHLSPAQLPSTG